MPNDSFKLENSVGNLGAYRHQMPTHSQAVWNTRPSRVLNLTNNVRWNGNATSNSSLTGTKSILGVVIIASPTSLNVPWINPLVNAVFSGKTNREIEGYDLEDSITITDVTINGITEQSYIAKIRLV
jgi:hypothetical protein